MNNKIINFTKNVEIVLSESSAEPEAFAATELQYYLCKATGIGIPIVSHTSNAESKMIIGAMGQAYLDDKNIKFKLEHDGFVTHCDENNLIIFGNSPRGTLNGVYSLLHDLGFRWVYPSKDKEIIPILSSLSIPEGTKITNPDLELRGVCIFPVSEKNVEELREIIDWMGKNRINLLMTSVDRAKKRENGWIVEWEKVSDQLLPEIQKRGIILNISEHSGRYFFPTSYFDEHPEWFAMNSKGERFSTGQICYSNDEAVSVLTENYQKYAKEHPEVDIIGTWPEDGYGFCQCTNCKKAGAVLKAVNKIAKKIEDVRPDLTVEYLSYTEETSTVPDDILPHNNIAILVANVRVAEEWLKKSNKAGARGIYQLHYHISDNTAERASLPLRFEKTRMDCLQSKEIGSRGIIPFFIGIDTWWRSCLNLYFLSQFSWNTGKSSQEILSDYCQKYYKKSASVMLPLFEALEKMPMVDQHTPPPWPLWQEWTSLKTDFIGEKWEEILNYFSKLRSMLDITDRDFDSSYIIAFIDSAETMFYAWHERACAVLAFEKGSEEELRKHITKTAEYEQRLIDLYTSNDGVNGARPDFSFFQNWRLQLDQQLLEMKTPENMRPITDENPDVELFLPGLLDL